MKEEFVDTTINMILNTSIARTIDTVIMPPHPEGMFVVEGNKI